MLNEASRPAPGSVVETPFGRMATCHLCRSFTLVWAPNGLIAPHDRPRGEGPCPHEWGAPDLATAIKRDEQLNDEEERVRGAVYAYLMTCKGPAVSDLCNHRICEERVAKGLRWTLMGWKKGDPL
jgi:hypothetical protein